MGLFDKFKKTAENGSVTKVESIECIGNVDLSKKISLRKELVVKEVERQNIKNTNARVVFVLDHSGSMSSLYNNGSVQSLLERLFPVAMHFDDNAEMEFYLFENSFKRLASVTFSNLEKYVEKVIFKSNAQYGGTEYAPVMSEIQKQYVKKNPSTTPTFVIFITDGDNSDKSETESVIKELSKYNIFWKFVGIGNSYFNFLQKLDEMEGRTVDNANFVTVENLQNITDAELYKLLLTEYADWQQACKNKGITIA